MKIRAKLLVVSTAGWLGTACIGAPPEAGDEEVAASSESLKMIGAEPADPPATASAPARLIRPPIASFPSAPVIYVPTYSDLQLDGTMRYYGGGTPTLGLQIDVTNHGTAPAYGPSGRVNVAGVVLSTALYQYYGGTATQANTVNPNERGYLQVEVPATLLGACETYPVQIDLDHTMQSGDASVFANDSANVTTICPLGWSTTIDTLHLGHPPDPAIAGKTLQNIVSSVVTGRTDGALCSSCHNQNSSSTYKYRPNVAPGVASSPIDPYMFIGGDEGWACGGDPWARQLVELPAAVYPKPDYLKEVFQKWLNDGGLR